MQVERSAGQKGVDCRTLKQNVFAMRVADRRLWAVQQALGRTVAVKSRLAIFISFITL